MKYNAMVWVGGQLEYRQLNGPPSFGAWRKCWRVFRTAMVLLRGSRAGALDAYEERIRTFADVYPDNWGTIARADDTLRSEGWERVRRDIQDKMSRGVYQGIWNASRPWEAVIRDSAGDTPYWQEDLRDIAGAPRPQPLRQPEAPAAWAQDGRTAGGRDPASAPDRGRTRKSARDKKDERRAAAFRGTSGPARSDGRTEKRQSRYEGKDICFAWNRSATGCKEGDECPNGRAHVCEWCLAKHRAVDPACTKKPEGWPAKKKVQG